MLLALEGPVAGDLAQLVETLAALPEDLSLALTPGCSQPPGSPSPGDLTPSKGRHLHSCDTQPCTIKKCFYLKRREFFMFGNYCERNPEPDEEESIDSVLR